MSHPPPERDGRGGSLNRAQTPALPAAGDPPGRLERQAGGELVKVFGWYDNEGGYAGRLVEMAARFSAEAT
ncbi:hypothetical protein [Streptosporangium sp. OZ121]|uniref:hypothetical protein n=1 Tax=Streptosporangium sp. OZ121 TaxID=3444183 RepID=UPI003F79C78F